MNVLTWWHTSSPSYPQCFFFSLIKVTKRNGDTITLFLYVFFYQLSPPLFFSFSIVCSIGGATGLETEHGVHLVSLVVSFYTVPPNTTHNEDSLNAAILNQQKTNIPPPIDPYLVSNIVCIREILTPSRAPSHLMVADFVMGAHCNTQNTSKYIKIHDAF